MPNDPKNVGRYEIEKKLGEGGFATVYIGRDPYINRQVAIKVSKASTTGSESGALSKLFQEAEAAGGLIHPNIVTIYDAGIQDPICYIAMEYIDGTTLHGNCYTGNLLPVAEAVDIMIKVCHGLDFAHQRGIIHRDVKPSNILLGTGGEIKIADFGLACFAELAGADKRTIGTPSYMPPEQVKGEGSCPQSDLFSVGVILYQLLCGAKPFEAKDSLEMRRKIVNDHHVPLKDKNPDLPPELFAITDRALEKKPEDRYRTGFEFARDLESVLHGSKKPLGGEVAERVKYLRTLKFFEEFADDEIAHILTIGTWLKHKPAEVVVCEDEPGRAFFVMAAGEAAVMVSGKPMGTLARGDCFGEVSFLLGRSRSATITAVKECDLLRLNPEKIDILAPATQIKIYKIFARTIATYLLRADGKV